MKSRFNAVDVAFSVLDIKKNSIGKRVANVYDINGKTYLIKLSGGKGKGMILIESGIRLHATEHDWTKPDWPNGFAMKLRKHLRGSLLFNVNVLITRHCLERTIDFDFGKHRLIVELYDHGNIFLTTHDYTIIYALRAFLGVGEKYPAEPVTCTPFDPMVELTAALENIIKDDRTCDSKDQLRRWLPKVLNTRFGGATVFLEHALCLKNIDPKTTLKNAAQNFESRAQLIDCLKGVIYEADSMLECLKQAVETKSKEPVWELNFQTSPCVTLSANGVFEEFAPVKFSQFSNSICQEYSTFSEAVDDFFWKQEDSKLKAKQASERNAGMKRIENVRKDHEFRVTKLREEAERTEQDAKLLEGNSAIVEKALSTVRTASNAGLSQSDIEQLLLEAKLMGDPTAECISKLSIDKGIITLELDGCLVNVELALNSILNTEKMWSLRRAALEKLSKTIAAAEVAIKNAESSISASGSRQLGEFDEKVRALRTGRKPFWFEQFAWFVSSDGRLVVAGKDHQQNETLVRRYMAATDIFVHCELHGAGVVLVKTGLESAQIKDSDRVPPPPSTLREAAIYAVSRSIAWNQGTPAHSFWVWGNQVSKTPQTGEFVTPGAFIIRGKRNILPLEPLVLGLGIVFVSAPKSNDEDPIEDSSDESEIENDKTDETQPPVAAENLNKCNEEKVGANTEDDKREEEDDAAIWDKVGSSTGKSAAVDEEIVVVSTLSTGQKRSQQQQKPKQVPFKKSEERPSTAPTSNKPKHQIRGQKGKLKKIKEKYADQDEEERQARMELLQSSGKKSEKGVKKGKEKQMSAPAKKTKEPKKQSIPQPVPMFFDDETAADVKHRLNRQRHQLEDALHRFVCDPIKKLPLIRFYHLGLQEEDQQELGQLLFALPVCAPYPSLQRCPFKVKLIPGKTKRGKVARAAVEAWLRQLTNERSRFKQTTETSENKDKNQQYSFARAMIKAVVDDEWSRNMPLSCKLMLSGAAQMAQQEKAKKKLLAKKQKQAAATSENS